MPDQEVVIVGADGTEHVFPAGFDPKRAAAIVKQAAPAVFVGRPKSQAVMDEGPDKPEGWFSKTVRGMVNPSPEMQLVMDVLPIGAAAAEAAPNALIKTAQGMRAAPGAVSSGAASVARGAVRAGAAAADALEAHPGVSAAVGGALGYATGGPVGAVRGLLEGAGASRGLRLLRVAQKLQAKAAAPTASAGPPRLVGKAPTLTDSLVGILDELRTDAATTPAEHPAVPGAAPGGAQAADLTMRQLADRPRTSTPLRQQIATSDADQRAVLSHVHSKGSDFTITPSGAAVEDARTLYEPVAPRPLKAAVTLVRQAVPAAKLKLNAVEFDAATRLAQQGYEADAIMDAIRTQRAVALQSSSSFANLPSDADVAASVGDRNATGRWDTGSTSKRSGNPFR